MKTIISVIILLATLTSITAQGLINIKIVWDPNPVSENVVSYNVYFGQGLADWTISASTQNTEYPITIIENHKLIGVTAVNAYGFESEKSVINYPGGPSAPSGLKVVVGN